MIRLSSIITTFETEFLARYGHQLLPGQHRALNAMKRCRSAFGPQMRVHCADCDEQRLIPHSCGHRACPHCQHHEGEQWLARQRERRVPATYFLLTFTLPAELRGLAWCHQRILYGALMRCAWETLRTFSRNDRQLHGTPGAIAVLHTHSRRLDYHPHVHLAVPAGAIDAAQRRWRTKTRQGKKAYLFSHKALAKVFRARMLQAITQAGLPLPPRYPKTWVVDCKAVGTGDSALVYLGRYLYRGVLREPDLVSCENGQVTFRYQDSKTRRRETRTLPGAEFLWLLLRHVLPKGFRRARNYGFLHPNSKHLIRLLQLLLKLTPCRAPANPRPAIRCPGCGGVMHIVTTRIRPPNPTGHSPTDAAAMSITM